MRILIVGNIIKDVYLNFDEDMYNFETDENGIPWIDIPFDGSHYSFIGRNSVFAGAAIANEIFNNFDIESTVSGQKHNFVFNNLVNTEETGAACDVSGGRPCGTYRYILCKGKQIFYLVPYERADSTFEEPADPVDWIFVDRSAQISNNLVSSIKKYLKKTEGVHLASFISTKAGRDRAHIDMRADKTHLDDSALELAKLSDIVFIDGEDMGLGSEIPICKISKHKIEYDGARANYRVDADDMMTHLTIYSIIAATTLAAIATGSSSLEAIRMAAINAENATINGTIALPKIKEFLVEENTKQQNLHFIAKSMVSTGKGILAADESGGSIHKKFLAAGIPDDEEHRRDYRNIFFTTHDLNKYVNGVILFDETARQLADNGETFTEYLTSMGIIPGIKVDQGLEPFTDTKYADEKWTKGLDDLPERLAEYYDMGLRFAKWRAAFEVKIENGEVVTPSDYSIRKNAQILAEYALDCQNAGIVPIVEPEVVHAGDYSIDVCKKLTGKILDVLFDELHNYNVDLHGCILKCNMVLAGGEYETQSTAEEVGAATAETLKAHVPAELAGVVFLSGGQGVEEATDNLQAVTNNGPFPWPVTFSYARALQGPALDAWQGNNDNADAAREAFYARLVANTDALTKK